MAGEDESDSVINFMAEQFKRLHARCDAVELRFDRHEERVAQVERPASTDLEESLVAQITSLHESLDDYRAAVVSFDRRIPAIEAR